MKNVTLRQAQKEDLLFLYDVSIQAIRPVVELLKSETETFEAFKDKFKSEEAQVIQYGEEDVGRLRVVRSKESIYVGGIQILPLFQRKGIGTKVLGELIREAEELQIPIVLEVHEVNASARSFYTKLGFVQIDVVKDKPKLVLQYSPVT